MSVYETDPALSEVLRDISNISPETGPEEVNRRIITFFRCIRDRLEKEYGQETERVVLEVLTAGVQIGKDYLDDRVHAFAFTQLKRIGMRESQIDQFITSFVKQYDGWDIFRCGCGRCDGSPFFGTKGGAITLRRIHDKLGRILDELSKEPTQDKMCELCHELVGFNQTERVIMIMFIMSCEFPLSVRHLFDRISLGYRLWPN